MGFRFGLTGDADLDLWLAVDFSIDFIGDVDLDLWSEGSGLFSLPRLLSIEIPRSPLTELAAELTEAFGL